MNAFGCFISNLLNLKTLVLLDNYSKVNNENNIDFFATYGF